MTIYSLPEALANGEVLKKQPIPSGHVRIERHDYHYTQKGQAILTHYLLKDVPELDAINWIFYGGNVQWPDGYMEYFYRYHTPIRHYPHLGYGTITRQDGSVHTGTLSRLQNVFVEYYNIYSITPEERTTFKKIEIDY